MKAWIVFLSLALFLNSEHALASDLKQRSASSTIKLTVSVFSLMPFGGQKGQGEFIGIIPEILKKISKKTGYILDLQVVPYKRMFLQLENGLTDFSIFFKTPQSRKVAEPIVKVYTLKNVIVGRKKVQINDYEDLKKYSISLPLGNFYEKRFDEDITLNKIHVPGFKNSVGLLLNKRTELVAGPYISIIHHLAENGYSKEILGEPFFLSFVSAWLQISRKSPNLTPEVILNLQNAVNEMHQEGTIEEIMVKYR